MTSSYQANLIEEAYNGGGWENSLSISSVEELKSKLLDLGASISFNGDFPGVVYGEADATGRLIISETEIDSYRSYLTSKKFNSDAYNAYGYFDNRYEEYNGSPVSIPLRPNQSFLNSLNENLNDGETAYLALNLDYPGIEFENGAEVYNDFPEGYYHQNFTSANGHINNTREVNPELVLKLESEFWEDYQNIYSDIERQQNIGNNIDFEVNGLNKTLDLSRLRFVNDNSFIESVVNDFNFSLVSDERWDLPLYGRTNAQANVDLYTNGSHYRTLTLDLKDHDLSGHQPPAPHGFSGAVELTETGDGTVLEFGLDPHQLRDIIREVQTNWNEFGTNTLFEVQDIQLNINELPGGGSYNKHIDIVSGDQYLTINPVTTSNSNFSEFGDVSISVEGDFNSVLNIWDAAENSPSIQLLSGDGLTKYENVSINLNYSAYDDSGNPIPGSELYIHSDIDGAKKSSDFWFSSPSKEYEEEVVEFRLDNINFDATPWGIASSESPSGNQAVSWSYNVDTTGQLQQNHVSYDIDGHPIGIEDYISNVDDLKKLHISGLGEFPIDQIDPSVELTLAESRLPWNVNYTNPEPSNTLETYYSLQELDQLAVLGDSVDEGNRYDLTITAKMLGDLRLEGAGLTIGFDNTLFNDLSESDVHLGHSFVQSYADNYSGYGPIYVDNEAGEIHISAISAEDLNLGKAISEESIFATISLDFDENALRNVAQNDDGSLQINPLNFSITADQDETVFSEEYDDGTGFSNRNIQSLRDLDREILVEGRNVTLYNAAINLEQLEDGLILGTQRVIGANQGFTNLIRSGDTITSTVDWRNIGNITAKNLMVYGEHNENGYLEGYSLSQNSLKSGSFDGGVFYEDGREDVTITADIAVTGGAGQVLDVSEGLFSIQAEGSDMYFENNGKGSANLITYQGDLNYDGRVSMKDLAYLNAGAARQIERSDGSIVEESVAHDVDANFDGKIDMGDLTILDQDWGQSLHDGHESFVGSNATLNWESLDSQSSITWDNTAFKEQNQIEAEETYVAPLGSSGDMGGGDLSPNNEDNTGLSTTVDTASSEPPIV